MPKPTLQRTATGDKIKVEEESGGMFLPFDKQQGSGSTDNGCSNCLMAKYQNDVRGASEHRTRMIERAEVWFKVVDTDG